MVIQKSYKSYSMGTTTENQSTRRKNHCKEGQAKGDYFAYTMPYSTNALKLVA